MIRLRGRVRPAAPPTAVYVVDGTDTEVGTALCERIGPTARPVVPEVLDTRAACVVVALPAHARVLPVQARRVLAVLGGFAGGGPERLRVPVVVSWCASHAARLRLTADASFNPAPLLVGAAWRDELRHHANPWIAAACRSTRVRGLVRSAARLGGTRPAQLLTTVEDIDPDCVHTLLVEVGDHAWVDLAAVVAAVELRVGAGPGGAPPAAGVPPRRTE